MAWFQTPPPSFTQVLSSNMHHNAGNFEMLTISVSFLHGNMKSHQTGAFNKAYFSFSMLLLADITYSKLVSEYICFHMSVARQADAGELVQMSV